MTVPGSTRSSQFDSSRKDQISKRCVVFERTEDDDRGRTPYLEKRSVPATLRQIDQGASAG
jgi:hypothetical protein